MGDGSATIRKWSQFPFEGAVAYSIAPSGNAMVTDELRARCAEILEWHQTGILRGSALRDYAGKLREKFGNVFDAGEALALAEKETTRELMEAALAQAGQPVAWGVFRNGEMIAWVPGPDEDAEYKLPEDTDERRPLYASPSKIEAGENTAETAAPGQDADGAPDRLWLGAADADGEHSVWFDPDEGGTLYVRADLAAPPVSREDVSDTPSAALEASP